VAVAEMGAAVAVVMAVVVGLQKVEAGLQVEETKTEWKQIALQEETESDLKELGSASG